MKKKLPLMALAAAVLLAAVLLTGALGYSAANWLKDDLNFIYRGAHSGQFRRVTGLSVEEAELRYDQSVEAEAAFLADWLDIDLALCGDNDFHLRNIARNLLADAKYQVGRAVRTDDGWDVEVTVYPLDVLQKFLAEDKDALMADWSARYDRAEFDAMPAAEYETLWAETLLAKLEPHVASPDYLEPVTVTAAIRKDADGRWALTPESFAAIDALIIAY